MGANCARFLLNLDEEREEGADCVRRSAGLPEPGRGGRTGERLGVGADFNHWILDMVSPALMQMMVKQLGSHLEAAGSPMKFGPEEGPGFFVPYGWKPVRVQSMLHVAARLKRLPFWMRPLALFPDKFPAKGKRPWGGACLMART